MQTKLRGYIGPKIKKKTLSYNLTYKYLHSDIACVLGFHVLVCTCIFKIQTVDVLVCVNKSPCMYLHFSKPCIYSLLFMYYYVYHVLQLNHNQTHH